MLFELSKNKLAAVLGAPAGFAAPPADAVTLTRVNGQVTTLYGQVWQADSEPTQRNLKPERPSKRRIGGDEALGCY